MTKATRQIGNYIERVKEVIPYNKEIPVKGLSCNKYFSETHITNLERIQVPFQLVKRGQFVTNHLPLEMEISYHLPLTVNYMRFKYQLLM